MPRRSRLFVAGQTQHVIQRGNNRGAIFFESDRRLYLEWLGEALADQNCALHAYVLMTNHVHLLITADQSEALPKVLQSLGRRYVRHVNRTYVRTGTLWEGRYKSTILDSERYVLACHRYIEANPVRERWERSRANLVALLPLNACKSMTTASRYFPGRRYRSPSCSWISIEAG